MRSCARARVDGCSSREGEVEDLYNAFLALVHVVFSTQTLFARARSARVASSHVKLRTNADPMLCLSSLFFLTGHDPSPSPSNHRPESQGQARKSANPFRSGGSGLLQFKSNHGHSGTGKGKSPSMSSSAPPVPVKVCCGTTSPER